MSELIVPVVLAGGSGTRLWPMSRAARPKQFLPLTGPESLFQETLKRVADPSRYAPPLVLTNNEYRFLVADQAQEAGVALTGVLLEPVARNTAPAIAAAALFAISRFGGDAVLHVLPSDHQLAAGPDYWRAADLAAQAARSGRLVTFGIEPGSAETGYGYIETGERIDEGVFEVARFVEKPDRGKAERMLAQGGFLWNSGMFMLGARAFMEECRRWSPDLVGPVGAAVDNAVRDLDFVRIEAEAFARAPNISVDYAVFERTDKAAVVPVVYAWSDLGSWDAVWAAGTKDAAQNVARGSVTLSNVSGSFIASDKAHVAVEGLEGVAIVATEDAVFVGKLAETQKVGAIVKRLRDRAETAKLTELHHTVYRPWGGYASLVVGDRFQVKRLFVTPGRRLSLQKHRHRAEHWVVVRGTAEVTIGADTRTLYENQSIYIPQGEVHRRANPGRMLLELIEVQTGSYLGEDDIIRIEDEFGRAGASAGSGERV